MHEYWMTLPITADKRKLQNLSIYYLVLKIQEKCHTILRIKTSTGRVMIRIGFCSKQKKKQTLQYLPTFGQTKIIQI